MTVLETQRLTIRRFTPEDAPFILRLLNEPSFLENIGDRGVRTLDDALRYLETVPIASYAKNGFGLWQVILRESGAQVGMCGLIKRDILEDVDLGYAFLPEFCGQGLATEAASATVRLAREQVGLSRLLAVVNPDNTRSIQLLEKLGFRHERMIRLAENEPPIRVYAVAL